MRNIEGMSHIMEWNSLILFTYFCQEFLQIYRVDLELFDQLEKLKHPVPATKQRPSIVIEIRHVNF